MKGMLIVMRCVLLTLVMTCSAGAQETLRVLSYNIYKVTRYMEQQGYADLYRTIHADPHAFPGRTSKRSRIDYIFYNQHVTALDCKVLEDDVFGSRGFDHSDHLAVFGMVRIGSAEKD